VLVPAAADNVAAFPAAEENAAVLPHAVENLHCLSATAELFAEDALKGKESDLIN
jgi:hypothetical protein